MKYFFITLLLLFAVSNTRGSNLCNCSNTIVTFQPGGTTSGTTFSSFVDLCSYISSTGNSTTRWIIQIDGSFTEGSPSIDTGTYNLPSSVEFIGLASDSNPGNYPTLSGNSVFFDPAPLELYFTNLPFVAFNNFPIIPLVTVSQTMYIHITDCTLQSFSPFFAAIDGGFISIRMYGFASFDFGSIIVTVDSISFASISTFDGASIASGTVTVDSGGTLDFHIVDSALIDTSYLTLADTTVGFLSIASQIHGLQSGVTSLHHGVSPSIIIPYLTMTSRIVATHSNTTGSTKIGLLKSSDRVIGSPGSFKIKSVHLNLNPVVGDNSAVEWHIIDTNN